MRTDNKAYKVLVVIKLMVLVTSVRKSVQSKRFQHSFFKLLWTKANDEAGNVLDPSSVCSLPSSSSKSQYSCGYDCCRSSSFFTSACRSEDAPGGSETFFRV